MRVSTCVAVLCEVNGDLAADAARGADDKGDGLGHDCDRCSNCTGDGYSGEPEEHGWWLVINELVFCHASRTPSYIVVMGREGEVK